MAGEKDMVRRVVSRAAWRLFLQALVNHLGVFIMLGLAGSILLLMLDRLLAVTIHSWAYYVVAASVVIVAVLTSWLRRPAPDVIASLIDTRLKLKDRLGTVMYLADDVSDDPFAHQVMQEAKIQAESVRLAAAFPVKLGTAWSYVPLITAIFVVLVVFIPSDLDLLGLQANRQQQQYEQQQAQAIEENILAANAVIRQMQTSQSKLEEADPTQIMKELAALTERDLSNPEMRREVVAKLSDVQEKLNLAKEAKEQEFRSLRTAMSGLDAGVRGPADQFADAMRRGDYEAAAKQLQKLAKQIEESDMSEADKERLRQQLENMAEQLQQMSQAAAQQQQQLQQQIQQQLQQAGLTQQQIQQLQQQGYNQQTVQQAIQQSLQNQGMNQQQAQQQSQQMAQQIQQQQQQSQAAANNSACSSGLCNSLGQMSQSLGQGQGQSQQQQGFSQGSNSSQQTLNQMAQMQQQLQQMGMAQSQLQNTMQNMCQGTGSSGGMGAQGGGQGGRQAGSGDGGNPYGPQRQTGPYTVRVEGDIKDRQGRVIASWLEEGEMAAGDATVEFDQAVTEARDEAERAVADDRVPRRYHETIREYFNQLPESASLLKQAPAAPR